MATKRKTAIVPVTGTDLSLPDDLADEFQKYVDRDAKVASSVASSGWPFISLKGGTFHYAGDEFDGPLPVIILASIHENSYYPGAYDPKNIVNPECFALNADESLMAPPETLATKQSDSCSVCWANEWDSAERTRGKACRNTIRISVLPATDLDADSAQTVEGARIRIPTMSMKGFGEYSAKVLKGLKRPLFSVVSNLDLVSDDKAQHLLKFSPSGLVNDPEVLKILSQRVDESVQYLESLPDTSGDAKEAKPRAGNRSTRKAGAASRAGASKVKRGR